MVQVPRWQMKDGGHGVVPQEDTVQDKPRIPSWLWSQMEILFKKMSMKVRETLSTQF